MLVVFRAKPAAEILMFAQHARDVLDAAGRHYPALPERGVITADQIDDLIAGIERAMAADTVSPFHDLDNQEDEENDIKEHPVSRPVTFRQRAFPLLAMLKTCREHKADIIWEPAPIW
ncbi:MAG: DUF1840 domain-containing protein [Pusillimonas sp.]